MNGIGDDKKKTTFFQKFVSGFAKVSPKGEVFAARAEITERGQQEDEPKKAVAFVDQQPLDYSSFASEGVEEDQPMVVPLNTTNPEDTPVSNRKIVMGLHRRKYSMEDINAAMEIPITEVQQILDEGETAPTFDYSNFGMEEAETVEIYPDGDVGPLVRAKAGSAILDTVEVDALAADLEIPINSDGNWGEEAGSGLEVPGSGFEVPGSGGEEPGSGSGIEGPGKRE